MKTRLATSLALAAAVSLGLTGCGLIAPQATLEPYSPSDGIEVTIEGVDVRNLMLVTGAEGEQFNVVFTGVNRGQSVEQLVFSFVSPSGSTTANARFLLEPGLTVFGLPDGDSQIISLRGVMPGATVTGYVQVLGGEVERQVPVIDGTLQDAGGVYAFPEYVDLVP